MSGFIAVFNQDGAPLEKRLLDRMARQLARRGPDRQASWSEGSVGLAHSLLEIAEEDAFDRQPLTLDDRVWITADARVDARSDLIHALRQAGDEIAEAARIADSELILRAYLRWGEACLDRLIGDFAFAIWDSRTQTLFAAHDQFAAVPLFYAHRGGVLIVSNTLNAVRSHPQVSDRLNEQAIGDFLCLGMNYDTSGTFFSDVCRLPAAYCLRFDRSGLKAWRYWEYVEPDYVEPRESEPFYVERFRDVFEQAVSDRLRGSGFGTHLSGGMDSTSVAVTAQEILRRQGRPDRLRAYTNCVSRYAPEVDYEFTKLVADRAGIPLRRFNIEDYLWSEAKIDRAEPYIDGAGTEDEIFQDCARNGRVLLTGYGGDPILGTARLYWRRMLLQGRWATLLREAREQKKRNGSFPGMGIRSGWWNRRYFRQIAPRYGLYLNPEFAARYRPEQRIPEALRSDLRLDARPGLSGNVLWNHRFLGYDPGHSGWPVKTRHPFFDVRVIASIGETPCRYWLDKGLLRNAMTGRLPQEVRTRRKTAFGNKWSAGRLDEIARNGLPAEVREAAGRQAFRDYIQVSTAIEGIPADPSDRYYWSSAIRHALALSRWLHYVRQTLDKPLDRRAL